MKKIFTYSIVFVLLALVFTSCRKSNDYIAIDEGYWLSQERGVVVYSSAACDFFVVETFNGYSIIRSYSGFTPYEGSVIYGDLSHWGTGDFYNRSERRLITGNVRDYWLSYFQAQDNIDLYCY